MSFAFRRLQAMIVVAVAVTVAATTASAQTAPDYSNVGPRFTRATSPKTVEGALRYGDRFRDAAHRLLREQENVDVAKPYAEQAKQYYDYVVEQLEPHNAYATLNLGYVELMLARYENDPRERDFRLSRARSKFTDALEKHEGYGQAHVYLGELYAMRKDWPKAAQEFNSLLRSEIKDAYIYAWYGYVMEKAGKPDEAKRLYRAAVEDGDPAPSAKWARDKIP